MNNSEQLRLFLDLKEGMKERAEYHHWRGSPIKSAKDYYGEYYTRIDTLVRVYLKIVNSRKT